MKVFTHRYVLGALGSVLFLCLSQENLQAAAHTMSQRELTTQRERDIEGLRGIIRRLTGQYADELNRASALVEVTAHVPAERLDAAARQMRGVAQEAQRIKNILEGYIEKLDGVIEEAEFVEQDLITKVRSISAIAHGRRTEESARRGGTAAGTANAPYEREDDSALQARSQAAQAELMPSLASRGVTQTPAIVGGLVAPTVVPQVQPAQEALWDKALSDVADSVLAIFARLGNLPWNLRKTSSTSTSGSIIPSYSVFKGDLAILKERLNPNNRGNMIVMSLENVDKFLRGPISENFAELGKPEKVEVLTKLRNAGNLKTLESLLADIRELSRGVLEGISGSGIYGEAYMIKTARNLLATVDELSGQLWALVHSRGK